MNCQKVYEDWYKSIHCGNVSYGVKGVCNDRMKSTTTYLQQRFSHSKACEKINSRKRAKRRGVSPKVFPYKIRVTEDKVARDLFNLQLSPPNHFQRRQRTISEIESSLTLDSDSEDEFKNNEKLNLKISEEFQKDIEEFRRSIFHGNSSSDVSSSRPEASKALVVWTPPLFPQPPEPEKEKFSNDAVTSESLSNYTDMQLDPDSLTNVRNLKKTFLSETFTTSNESDNFEYDDAMEL